MRRSVLVGALGLACAAAPAPAAGQQTTVSLAFDAATANQAQALPVLAAHGLRATFFVPSGFVGTRGHLTWGELRHMQAIGHEIGGQTRTHARLPGLTRDRMRRQVCGDRRRLLAHGLAADAFAYPFGAYSSIARDVVMGCGYTSARLASGIAGAGKKCIGCPYAETIPPRNRYATRLPAGVQRTSTVKRLKDAVRDAQRTGGGWLQLLFHHVCDGCGQYAITVRDLDRLLDWIARRPGVQVRTVGQLLDLDGPSVRVGAPSWIVRRGARLTFTVRTRSSRGLRRVRYFVDGRQVGVRNLAPWRLKWIPLRLRPGRHTLRALVEDAAGNAAISPRRTFVTR